MHGEPPSLPMPAAVDPEPGEQDVLLEQRGITDGGQAKSDRRFNARLPSPKLLLGVCLLLISAACIHFFDAEALHAMFVSLQGDPLTSGAIYFIINTVGIPLMLPGMVLSIGAGALFGFVRGFCLSWAATALGTAAAFTLGRYLLADMVASYVAERFPGYPAIETALAKEGWKLVFLLKVAPFCPWNVLNYVMSASPISLAGFALPSAAAAIPYTLLFCYMGSASNDLMAALQGGGDMHVSMTWLIVSPLLLLASGAGVVLLMKRIMASTTQAALVAAEFELPVTVANALTSSCMGHHALVDQDDGEDTAHARGSCIELGERERLSLDVRHEPCSPMLGPVTHIISSAPRRPRVSSPA